MAALQQQVTGVLVFDGEPETVGVNAASQSGGVVVFDGRPSIGAITRQIIPGVTVVATTGPRGAQGIQGIQGVPGPSAYQLAVQLGYGGTEQQWIDSIRGFVLVEPNEEPPLGTPDRTFVFEHVG